MKNIIRFFGLLFFLHLAMLSAVGCSSRWRLESYRPVLGDWITERGIVMSIHMSADGKAEATIELSPGYEGGKIRRGERIITDITPLVDGGYTGLFEMPGGLKPVKVKLGLLSPDRLAIVTWDRRAENKVMVWRRAGTASPEGRNRR